jgi:hypothetical protein
LSEQHFYCTSIVVYHDDNNKNNNSISVDEMFQPVSVIFTSCIFILNVWQCDMFVILCDVSVCYFVWCECLLFCVMWEFVILCDVRVCYFVWCECLLFCVMWVFVILCDVSVCYFVLCCVLSLHFALVLAVVFVLGTVFLVCSILGPLLLVFCQRIYFSCSHVVMVLTDKGQNMSHNLQSSRTVVLLL